MLALLRIIFWTSLSILFYCYIGYGILLFLYNNIKVLFKKKVHDVSDNLPAVTIIISAYNEENVINKKIQNTLAIDYPKELLHIIIVADGSNDGTVEMIKKYENIQLMHQSQRRGKYAAIKRAMKQVLTPIVVFSDANTMLNTECLRKMVIHYEDKQVGGVSGEKKILRNHFESVVGEAEGLYWQYESFLKQMDAELNTLVGAAGELYSIRTELFNALEDDVILDDFVISMQVCLQGYKMEYEPDAFATESPSVSLHEEEKRKIRISAGAYQSFGILKKNLNLFKYPILAFQFISRRLLRWIFCPLALLLLLITNIYLMIHSHNHFFSTFLWMQTGFYAFALMGWVLASKGKRTGLFTIPFYFVFMNYCLVRGFIRFVLGKQSVLWEKSLRESVV
ncbi:MAG: glycosyltransferase family 2 protein [Bacteroidetes bacterium]|nr:glycosyltransferase family 2 protein [Bacteroidota bacterium]